MNINSTDNEASTIPILYKQTDNIEYTDKQLRISDDTDLPYIEDPKVSGDWSICDFVPDITDFKPYAVYTPSECLPVMKISFLPRGICQKHFKSGAVQKLRYTKGTVIDQLSATAEQYEIKIMYDREFLFVQHKSGDYSYGGKKPHWYVYKREN